MRSFIVTRGSFIADTLVAEGSIVTDEDLRGAEPGSALVEVDPVTLVPVNQEEAIKLRGLPTTAPIEIAPIAPHAPNPTQPQAVPAHGPGAAAIVARGQTRYVPAEGVESYEAAEARATQLREALAAAEAQAAALREAEAAGVTAEPPTRRSSRSGDTGNAEPTVLDQSIPDLEASLADINDADELQRLREQEVGGKSRSGALSAIDARIAELDQG